VRPTGAARSERGLERFADPQNKLEMATLRSSPISTHDFQLRGGGNLAVVKGVMKRLLERKDASDALLDREFVAEHTESFEALAADH
jgi:anaerobic selenocysteine-containing dehydrogenase